jgi:hypothetical protein
VLPSPYAAYRACFKTPRVGLVLKAHQAQCTVYRPAQVLGLILVTRTRRRGVVTNYLCNVATGITSFRCRSRPGGQV